MNYIRHTAGKKKKELTGLEKFSQPATEEEKEFIQKHCDRLCDSHYLIRKDKVVKKYINSHKQTNTTENQIFKRYQETYLEIQKELRTDNERIVHL